MNSAVSKDHPSHLFREKPIKVLRMIARLNIGGPAINVNLLTEGLDKDAFSSTLVTGVVSAREGDMRYLFEASRAGLLVIPDSS
jgi:hypothetical protein